MFIGVVPSHVLFGALKADFVARQKPFLNPGPATESIAF